MKLTKKTAYLQLHRICDQDCIFCAQPTNGKYLNFWEITQQIDYYHTEWYTDIIFSGGEPSMSPYFFETLKYCRELGLEMRILTNGHMFEDKEFAKKSLEEWLHSYHISLHSHIERIHDTMVKKEWSYKRSLRAMNNILLYWWELTINITINNYNVSYFPKTILFFLKMFPDLKGFIINNLETSQITSKYYGVIASLGDIKKIIIPAIEYIQSYDKDVRIERVPMCYMRWYEHLSTDVEYSLMDEVKYLHYLDDNTISGELTRDTFSADYTYWDNCNSCDLKWICAWLDGIGKHYSQDDFISQSLSQTEFRDLQNNISHFLKTG